MVARDPPGAAQPGTRRPAADSWRGSSSPAGEGELEPLQGIDQRLVRELDRLDRIRKSPEILAALNMELSEDEVERGCPIEVHLETAENGELLAAVEE